MTTDENLFYTEVFTQDYLRKFRVEKIFYEGRTKFQYVQCFANALFGKILFLDKKIQSAQVDEHVYHESLVHPAMMTHPSPKDILVIGGGDGGALKDILIYPVETVCHVEIDVQVIEVGKEHFPWLSPCLEDERVELIISDGLEFLKETEWTFDIIFVDSSEPIGPSAALHRKDFYESAKTRLNTDSVVVAQIGSPLYHLDFIKECSKTFKELFQFVRFYVGPAPSYPGGSWCYVFLSDSVDPLNLNREPLSDLKYYNQEIHRAAFSLPPFVREYIQ